MNIVDIFQNKPIHHAHFLIGDRESIVATLVTAIEQHFGIDFDSHPDVFHTRYSTLTIDDAHFLAEREQKKAFVGPKIFMVSFDAITFDAQQALLKLLEEPRVNTFFFLTSPQDVLLPTLRSRVLSVHMRAGKVVSAADILSKNPSERMALVKELTAGIGNEEKTKQDAIDLVSVLETHIYKIETYPNRIEALHALTNARTFLYQSGAPTKLILEYLMVSI